VSQASLPIFRLASGVSGRVAVRFAFACLAILVAVSGCEQENGDATSKRFEIEKEYKRGPVTFVIRVDKKEITIADRLRLEMEVRANEDYDVKLPEFGEKLEEFGIVDYHAPPAMLGETNTLIIRKSYVLEPFLSGDYIIPPMEIVFWKKEEKEKKHELESEELTVKVKSMLPEKTAELVIKDIAPPVELPRRAGAWPYWLLGVGLLVACGVTGLVVWRRRRARPGETARRPAHEIAYSELESLLAGKLVEKGQTKAFYIALSDILRHYIENRFGMHAPERTTEEFLTELRSTDVLAASHKDILEDFLRRCDMVKFAEHQPSTGEIQKIFDACKRFIVETEEKPDEIKAPAKATSEVASHAV